MERSRFSIKSSDPLRSRSLTAKRNLVDSKLYVALYLLFSRWIPLPTSQQTRRGLFRHQAILDTMLTYYQYIKSDIDTASSTGIHPVGALALVSAAVCTSLTVPTAGLVIYVDQVGRAIKMHKTGVFVHNSTPFSEKDMGKDTAACLKLIKELSEDRWTAFYSALKTTATIFDELRVVSKANSEPLQDEPENYHIQDSDPIDPGEGGDIDME